MGIGDLRGKRLSFLVGLVGAFGFMLQGYDQNITNGLLTLNSFIKTFPQIDTVNTSGAQKSHNSNIQGVTVAIYEAGCAIGALACAFLGDRLGRRRTIFVSAAVVLVGLILQATPFQLAQLIVGRIITGLGVGGFTATIPMYVSESSKAATRGRMVLMGGWFAIGGIVIATWMEFGFYYLPNSSVSWRFPIAFQSVFAIIVVSCILFLPESPRWLVRQDRMEDAAQALARLEDVSGDSEAVAQGLDIIQQSLQDERGVEGSDNPFAMNKSRNLHRTIMAVSVNFLAQMTGVNVITFYSDIIFQTDLGYSGTISRIISGCLQLWQFFCAGIAILLIDRLGRRRLLITAAAGMTIAQACLAGLSSDLANTHVASASIFFYFLALTCFPIGLFLVPFMYAAEISPLQTRAKVAAMSASANWLFNFLIAEVTPIAFANIAWKYYLVYACISAFACAVFFFFFPETKGRSLEEIDEIFTQSKSIFDTVRISKEMVFHPDVLATMDEKEAKEHLENV